MLLPIIFKLSKMSMKFRYMPGIRPLFTLDDQELVEIVMLFCRGTFQVNNREIIGMQVRVADGYDTTTLEFRLSTRENGREGVLVCGFSLMLWDGQADLDFTPYSRLFINEDYFLSQGFNEEFAPHCLGLKGVYAFFSEELGFWNFTHRKLQVRNLDENWKDIFGDYSL